MNQILNEDVKEIVRSIIPNNKNIIKANNILSKATYSHNFYKPKNKNDIMEKITNILNDKHNKENFDSCYLIGNPTINVKNPNNYKYNTSSNANNNYNSIFNNNKNDYKHTAKAAENKFFKPNCQQQLQEIDFTNINHNGNNNNNNINNNINGKKDIVKYLKNEGINAFSPKTNIDNNNNNFKFFDRLNIYRDSNLIRLHMPYASSTFMDKNQNKIFTEKVNNEINSSLNNTNNKKTKNNFKLFHEQLNNSKTKHNKNNIFIRESMEIKPDHKIPEKIKSDNENEDKSPKYIKCRDSETTNLFLTKFNIKNKQKDNSENRIFLHNNKKNTNHSHSSNLNRNFEAEKNENEFLNNKDKDINNKDNTKNQVNFQAFPYKEKQQLESCKNINNEHNVSKSIGIEKEANLSYYSLKNEFSFLLEKKNRKRSL